MSTITDTTLVNDLKAAGFTPLWYDVGSLVNGGMFVRASDDSFGPNGTPSFYEVIEITDLDSACGADGQVLITARSTSFEYESARRSLRRAVDSCGDRWTLKAMARTDKTHARLMLAAALASYGSADPCGYGDGCSVATLDRKAHAQAREPWESTVPGFGMTAFRRAIREAIDNCR